MVAQASTKRSVVLLPGPHRQSSIFKTHMKETTGFRSLHVFLNFLDALGWLAQNTRRFVKLAPFLYCFRNTNWLQYTLERPELLALCLVAVALWSRPCLRSVWWAQADDLIIKAAEVNGKNTSALKFPQTTSFKKSQSEVGFCQRNHLRRPDVHAVARLQSARYVPVTVVLRLPLQLG